MTKGIKDQCSECFIRNSNVIRFFSSGHNYGDYIVICIDCLKKAVALLEGEE